MTCILIFWNYLHYSLCWIHLLSFIWHLLFCLFRTEGFPPRLEKPFSSFHSILFFHLFQSSKQFHFIPLFSTIFFNFPNPYTISLNLNHLYHLEICKVKPFFKSFFKPFSKPFSNHLEWSKMTKMVFPNTWFNFCAF